MSSSASRSSYKLVLILTVFALMLPAPVFATQSEPPSRPEAIIGLGLINDSPTVLGSSTGFTATVGGFTPITYTWNFDDGSTEVAGPASVAAYSYGAVGFYTAIVTATDGTISNTISATTPVTITAPCTSGLVVENTNDSGCGSLRYAVSIATPGDTVTFTPTLASQTITLTTGQIIIDKSITIDGAGAPGVTVSGDDNDRVFDIPAESNVTLNALIIVHGWVGEGTGAGINNAGTLTVRNSTVTYNDGMLGGGIYNGGMLALLNSTLSFNTGYEGSGFYNDGVATVLDNTFTQNQASSSGGGVYNGFNAVMTMANSTLSANSVTDVEMGRGGGLHNSGSLTVTNSTFYTNTSPVSNSGGGLFNDEGASLALANTVIAHSAGGDCLSWSTINSNINNLIEDASCSAALSGDPLLDPLANNGGPTLTHLPQSGSPAIDAGDNASAAGLTYDQRGPGFPRVVSSTVDIGAVEVTVEVPILTAINDSPTVLGSLTNFTATLSSPPPTARPSGVVPYAYTWNFGDGTPAGTGATPSHTYGAVGYYTAIVTATSPGLTLTATTPVTIVDQALQNLTAINDSPTVLSNLTSFTATVASGSNVVYSWNFGDGATGTGQYPVHTYGAIGFYTALVTVTNGVSTLTTTTPVTITEQPLLNLVAINDSPTPLGNTTNLLASVLGHSATFTWAFGDGATGADQSPSHIYGAVGFYTAVVTATNSVSTLTTTTRVTITDQPILNLTAINDSPTVLGNTTHLTATASGSNIAYTWAFGDGGIGAGQTPARIYGAAGVYTAVVTATNSISTVVAATRVTITHQTQHYSTYLPLLMNSYFRAPDLIVQSVAASSDVITVVIKNIGDAPAAESFWVDAYVDPNPPPTAVNQIWWDQGRSKQGVAWAVVDPIVPILPGQVITLTSMDATVSPERTLFTGTLTVGTPIYAQVDSYNYQTNYGAVLERHEILGLPYNNILGPVYSTAGSTHLANVIARPPAIQLDHALPSRSVRP